MQVGKVNKDKRKQKHRQQTDAFYLSTYWRRLVDYVWQRDEYECQECKRNGISKLLMKPSPTPEYRGFVDHIVSRKSGGSDEVDNLELLCKRCHDVKSVKEREGYRRSGGG